MKKVQENQQIRIHRKKISVPQLILNLFFIVVCACYILPFCMIITISLSSSNSILADGFQIFPKSIDTTAYKIIFNDMSTLLQAYKVTIEFTVAFTILHVVVCGLLAYPISKNYFFAKKSLTWYIFFTMLFGAGLVPSYITNTKIFHLGNSFWAYVIPGLVYAWNVIIMRTAYQGIPNEMLESAKIDGAGEFRTFITMVVPLSKPTYATIAFMALVGKWNDWNTALVYIRDPKLYSLQYLLQTLLRNAAEFEKMMEKMPNIAEQFATPPTDQMQFAMALLAAGPVLVIFPFFQKFFSKGMVVGSVKG